MHLERGAEFRGHHTHSAAVRQGKQSLTRDYAVVLRIWKAATLWFGHHIRSTRGYDTAVLP